MASWKEKLKRKVTIQKALLPVKAQQFLHIGGIGAVTVFVTVHMKLAGLSIAEITFINTFIPVLSILSPPAVGFCSDRIGHYKLVTSFVVGMTAVLFSSMLLPPAVNQFTRSLEANVLYHEDQGLVTIEKCRSKDDCNQNSTSLSLIECRIINMTSNFTYDIDKKCSRVNESEMTVIVDHIKTNASTCLYKIQDNYRKEIGLFFNTINLSMTNPGDQFCQTRCRLRKSNCKSVIEERGHTFWSFLVLRLSAQFFMASSVNMVDATVMGALRKHGGDFGMQRMWAHFAQLLFPFLSGALMDASRASTGKASVWPAYVVMDVCFFILILLLYPLTIHVDRMKGTNIENLKRLATNKHCIVLFAHSFCFAIAPGFLQIFIPIYLMSRNSPMSIIGLTVTTSFLAGFIFAFFSDWIINGVGYINVLCAGFLINAFRLFCYTVIEGPLWAVLIESLKGVTQHLCWVTILKLAEKWSPRGLLSSTIGTVRSVSYGLGRTVGIVAGGACFVQLGERRTFQLFSGVHLTFGLAWLLLHRVLRKRLLDEPEKTDFATQEINPTTEKMCPSHKNSSDTIHDNSLKQTVSV